MTPSWSRQASGLRRRPNRGGLSVRRLGSVHSGAFCSCRYALRHLRALLPLRHRWPDPAALRPFWNHCCGRRCSVSKGLAGQTFQKQRSGLAMVLLLVARLLWHRYRCRLSHSVWRRPARNPVVGTWLKSIPFRLQSVWHSLSKAIDSDDSIKEIGGCFNHR